MTILRSVGLAMATVLGLAGCSSNADQAKILRSFFTRGGAFQPTSQFIALAQKGSPAYVVSVEKREGAFSTFLRQTENAKGEETWISGDNLSLGMKDGMIIATRGFGGDMLAADAAQTASLLRAGREGVTDRFITLINGEDHAETLSFKCRITSEGPIAVDLGTYTAQTDQFYETCRNGEFSFINIFLIERGSRDIVQSRQWVSDYTGTLAMRVIPNTPH